MTITQIAQSLAGDKVTPMEADELYPQLSYEDGEISDAPKGNNAIKWSNTPEHLRKQLVETGLFTEDGVPTKSHQNPINQLRSK